MTSPVPAPDVPKPRAHLSGGRLIALAALAGALVGAVALYAKGRPSDNSVAANSCAANSERAESIAALAKGDVAGMSATEPRSLSTLAFQDASGAARSLADFAGKTVLLNLWATWCAPCRAEMPALDALQAQKGSETFEVVALNLDRGTDSKPQDFYGEIGITSLALYRDGSLNSFNDLKGAGLVLGLPVTMLIGPDGCLLAAMNGPAHWNGPDALAYVDGALALTAQKP